VLAPGLGADTALGGPSFVPSQVDLKSLVAMCASGAARLT
jgi:hypothetical protein